MLPLSLVWPSMKWLCLPGVFFIFLNIHKLPFILFSLRFSISLTFIILPGKTTSRVGWLRPTRLKGWVVGLVMWFSKVENLGTSRPASSRGQKHLPRAPHMAFFQLQQLLLLYEWYKWCPFPIWDASFHKNMVSHFSWVLYQLWGRLEIIVHLFVVGVFSGNFPKKVMAPRNYKHCNGERCCGQKISIRLCICGPLRRTGRCPWPTRNMGRRNA